MRKRNTAIISLLLLCVVTGGAIWITSNSAAQSSLEASVVEELSSSGEENATDPLNKINGKARAANSGGESEIRALADEIFATYQFDEAPAGMGDSIKERLVRAELSYRGGQGQQGISDASIVRAVNYLAYKLGAPAYAQTDVFELRRMKAAILPYTDDLQARSRAAEVTAVMSVGDQKTDASDAHAPTMSPLEAIVFMTALVQQKQFNPDYQLTNEEFVALHGNKRQANSHQMFRSEMHSRLGDTSRSKQLVQQVEKHAATMSLSEIVNLPEELMYVLGVGK